MSASVNRTAGVLGTESNDLASQSICVLGLTARVSSCLAKNGIDSIGKLIQLTESELYSHRNLGRQMLEEISVTLSKLGLRLGMDVEGVPHNLAISNAIPRSLGHQPEQQPSLLAPMTPLDAAVAALEFLKKFPQRESGVIRHRIIERTATLQALAQQFDVTRERIRQIEQMLRRRLESWLEGPGQAVSSLARRVRGELGSAVPLDVVSQSFLDLCSPIESDRDRSVAAAFLRFCAGPYERFGRWEVLHRTLVAVSQQALLAARDDRGWLPSGQAQELLQKAEVRPEHHATWLRTLGFLKMDDGWLLRLTNIPDRVEQLLLYRGEPMLAEQLLTWAGCDNVRSLRNRLFEDDRFKRTTKQGHFALREWAQYDEYSGIADEIAEEIARQGGIADAQHLVDEISKRYGVKANSVQQYLAAPMFIRIGQGQVRLRAPEEMRTVRADPCLCAGLYRLNEQWALRVRITPDTMRGSGRPIPAAVAAVMGCQPGARCVLKSPCDEIVVSWPVGSASGPTLGSLKPDVDALGGAVGDYVFLAFGASDIGVSLLKAEVLTSAAPLRKLSCLLGLPGLVAEEKAWTVIAQVIGLPGSTNNVTAEDVHHQLMRRNEVDLARLVYPAEHESPEAVFQKLEDMLRL